MEISSVNFIHLLHLTSSSCEKCNYGLFPFNGLTGQTRILFSVPMERSGLFLKYLAKMDLILILSKFSGQIGPKSKCFVFHSTI